MSASGQFSTSNVKKIAGLAIMLSLLPLIASAPTTFYGQEYTYIQNAFLKAESPVSTIVFSHKTGLLGDLIGEDREYSVSELKELVRGNILNCLIEKESNWRADVYGDSGNAYGLLQFHKSTFEMFSKRYNLYLDYYSSQDQILLAGIMISENFNNIYHWSVADKCLK